MKEYLENLNHEQIEAVTSDAAVNMVLAGAGTGKTRVLISRIGHLIEEKHADPNKILAMTFTKKAAKEMKKRIAKIAEGNPQITTIHAWGAEFMRHHALYINFPTGFSIWDEADQSSVRAMLIEKHPEWRGCSEELLPYIAWVKTHHPKYWRDLADVQSDFQPPIIPGSRDMTPLTTAYHEYIRCQRDAYALDFQDLISVPLGLLTDEPLSQRYLTQIEHL
ncbi:MAG: UvrD-helicase domain-containing protein, partial [Victivallaceae bacterium]|nr:UvrD-helicase domain-containing protein [Victivallaceae bacterium]